LTKYEEQEDELFKLQNGKDHLKKIDRRIFKYLCILFDVNFQQSKNDLVSLN